MALKYYQIFLGGMNLKKYNSNYIKNSKEHKRIEKVVNEFMYEEINKKTLRFFV